ncbi:hypothetical protein COO91_10794 (plasmid) [Nostoc flagelliforme CCNUN1]|uniref:Uncharacterized protein n=1 Tax=Nostoc flagelliforme CCNUN1 TaxID=2038116 RepID=A0A2K8TA33_9NOSO|nr:hypothetical protein COO91_10794 [Nostoc flagelliforme CCNUN1]
MLWQATTSISTQIKRRSQRSGQLLRSPFYPKGILKLCHKQQQL